MLAARALSLFLHLDPRAPEVTEDEAVQAAVGGLLANELLVHLRALSGQEARIKIVK